LRLPKHAPSRAETQAPPRPVARGRGAALAKAEEHSSGLAAFVGAFLTEAPKLLTEARRAAQAGDRAALATAAKALRGASLTFNATELADLCADLEAMARAGNKHGFVAQVDRCDAAWSRAKSELAT